jgi:hypothetical protein
MGALIDKAQDDLAQKILEEGIEYAATNWPASTPEGKRAQEAYLVARAELLRVCGVLR